MGTIENPNLFIGIFAYIAKQKRLWKKIKNCRSLAFKRFFDFYRKLIPRGCLQFVVPSKPLTSDFPNKGEAELCTTYNTIQALKKEVEKFLILKNKVKKKFIYLILI